MLVLVKACLHGSSSLGGITSPVGVDEGVPPWYYCAGASEDVAAAIEIQACGVVRPACQRQSEVELNSMDMVVCPAGVKVLTLAVIKCAVAKPQCDCARRPAAHSSWS